MARHEKGFSGSKPIDPVRGAKEIKLTVKLGKYEAWAAYVLAEKRGTSRSEVIRQLLKTTVEADPELHQRVMFELHVNAVESTPPPEGTDQ